MALIPILGGPGHDATNMVINGITLRPVQEIYPSPSQLPGYKVYNPVTNSTPTVPWPLAFRAEQGGFTLGRDNEFSQGYWFYTFPNYCYNNGQMLAHYLAGTNSAGQPIQWPSFPGSSSAGFAGKYTSRQIDDIVAQIVSLGSKAISADYPYPASTDYPTNNVTPGSDQWEDRQDAGAEGMPLQGFPFHVPRLAEPSMGDGDGAHAKGQEHPSRIEGFWFVSARHPRGSAGVCSTEGAIGFVG